MSAGKSTNPSVRKGGQTGGRETGGCSDQVCQRTFLALAKIFNSRIAESNSMKILLLAEKLTLKVEIPVF